MPQNYIAIKKELYQKIQLPSKAILGSNGEVIEIENIASPRQKDRLDFLKKMQIEINRYKTKLFDTDYQAIKYAEGQMTEEDYRPIREQRQAWRDEINKIQNELEGLE